MLKPVWRSRRTLAGVELPGSAWVDACEEDEIQAPRRAVAPRLYPEQPWERSAGMEAVPRCRNCGSVTVWRGTWQCAGCAQRACLEVDDKSTPVALPREALAGTRIFSTSEGNNSTQRAQWLWSVEALTSFHRRKQAAHYRGSKSADVTWVDLQTGELTPKSLKSGKWHADRVRGQAERFERVSACGTFEYALDVTDEAGNKTSRAIRKRCDCWRVCPRCLNKRKWKLSEGMKQQRALALARCDRGKRTALGKWTEKLITFTVPHGKSGPAEDARVVVDAWQRLLRKIRNHLGQRLRVAPKQRAKRGGPVAPGVRPATPSVPWCRALEVAPGDAGGHAHLHVWWYGPFLDVVLLRAWWGGILEAAGVDAVPTRAWRDVLTTGHGRDSRLHAWLGSPSADAEIPWPVVDIRAGGEAAAFYTQKVGISLYITKGTETSALEPAHAASIYEVFEGTRAVQWARGWAPPKKPLRAKCVTFRRLTEEEKALLNHTSLTLRNKAKSAEITVQKVEVQNVHVAEVVSVVPIGQVQRSPAQLSFEITLR